jgi:hypothetical protein
MRAKGGCIPPCSINGSSLEQWMKYAASFGTLPLD